MLRIQHLKQIFKYLSVLVFLVVISLSLDPSYVNRTYSNQAKENIIEDVKEEKEDSFKYESPWTWICNESTSKCQRTLKSQINETNGFSLKVCWLKCGEEEDRTLWPAPTVKKDFGQNILPFDLSKLNLKHVVAQSQKARKLVENAFQNFHSDLKSLSIFKIKTFMQEVLPVELEVTINILNIDDTLNLLTDESYDLFISTISDDDHTLTINITSSTFFGARHGLETLSQLIIYEDEDEVFKILNPVHISDKPKFPYRGLMIDTARNFIPIVDLKRVIRGMSYVKLNMLHLHFSDTNSFPVLCPSVPEMAIYGSYSKTQMYYPTDLKKLIQYALVRGIKIIPEIDAPSHAGHGWEWGEERGLGSLAYCIDEEPWNELCGQPPCGQLNPSNPKVYDILELIYKDLSEIFDADLFHMGGDEVTFTCWQNEEIKKFMNETKISTYLDLWAYFQQTAFERLRNHSVNRTVPIIWTSKLTSSIQIKRYIEPTEYIIQSSENLNSRENDILIKEGFPIILSPVDSTYLDWGAGSWLGKGHNWKYINWQEVYDLNLSRFDTDKKVENKVLGTIPQILGGEAPLWSEKVDHLNMDSKLWPRGLALAERLWTSRKRKPKTYSRILWMAERMKSFGISSDTRQPLSCILVNGNCVSSVDKL